VVGKFDGDFAKKVLEAQSKGKKPDKKPWPGHHPWPHHWPHRVHYPTTIVSPVIVPSTPTYVEPEATNPVPLADIRLVNPMENQVTLSYRLDDGEIQSLPAGTTVTINQAVVISFDRGGNAAQARYSLTDGTYTFIASGGLWDLVRQPTDYGTSGSPPAADTNPVPGGY